MIKARYTSEGTKGLLQEGGSGRRTAVEKMVGSLGGKVEAFYFAFGDSDVYVIVDLPDANAAMATSLTINATGAVHVATVPLFTPEDVDSACKKSVGYRAPGK